MSFYGFAERLDGLVVGGVVYAGAFRSIPVVGGILTYVSPVDTGGGRQVGPTVSGGAVVDGPRSFTDEPSSHPAKITTTTASPTTARLTGFGSGRRHR